MLRTYEKFGNTLLDGLGGGGDALLLFSKERRLFSSFVQKIIQYFYNCNYDQNSS